VWEITDILESKSEFQKSTGSCPREGNSRVPWRGAQCLGAGIVRSSETTRALLRHR
jgi:hypothetical protein